MLDMFVLQLVEKFISETIFVNNPAENRRALAEKNSQVLQSQLYIGNTSEQ